MYELEFVVRPNEFWWNQESSFKFLSIIAASVAVIVTPIEKIIKSINIVRYVSYFIIFESFIYYILPTGDNFFSTDVRTGYRFEGGLGSYIITGQLLLAGMVSHFHIKNKQKIFKVILLVFLYGGAIIATQERTALLSFALLILVLFYRSGFSKSLFLFRINKSIISVIIVSIFLSVAFLQYKQSDAERYDFYKSTYNRAILWIRSYELSKEVFPFGSGPGTQTYSMFEEAVKMDTSKVFSFSNSIKEALVIEETNFKKKMSNNHTSSPHNTYFDYLTPIGAIGLFYVFSIFYIQMLSLKRLLINRNNSRVFLDSLIISSLIFFMLSSLGALMWFYLIFYRFWKHNNQN